VRNQQSDTPDQSAARSTTLGHLLSKEVPIGKGSRRKLKGGVRVARTKDTERQRRTQHQSAQEGERTERSRKGSAKGVTPFVKISGWLRGYEQGQRAREHKEPKEERH